MNAVSNKKRPTSMAFYSRPTGTQISRGFKVHNVITCESKGQVVVSLGRHWVLTNGTWHVLLQSGNVFELGGITILILFMYTNKLMTSFSTVFQRFPKTFVRFSKILQKLSKVQTIVSGHFRTLSRIAKDFWNNRRFLGGRIYDVSIAQGHI